MWHDAKAGDEIQFFARIGPNLAAVVHHPFLMWWIYEHRGASLVAFVRSDIGAAPVRTGVVLAALLGVAVITFSFSFGDRPAAPVAVSVAPLDHAVVQLMALPMRTMDAAQTRLRLERHADSGQHTAAQLRNAHRTWARRVAQGTYADPDLAADMLAITTQALELRGIRPHPDA